MTFENWWNDNRDALSTKSEKRLAKAAWNAATVAERQRCLEVVKEVASASSIIGIGVANQIAEKIGE